MIDFNAPPLSTVLPILMRGLKLKTLPKPRALKSDADKLLRTRSIAEVFTPSRIVKFMVDALDDGNPDSRWLEIACGEAPFITTRYDAESGEPLPIELRAGVLDRKLRRIPNGVDKFTWASRAVQSVYGCELQADSLLIARANVLLTVAEFVGDCTLAELYEVAEVVAQNFWQTDILKPPPRQIALFDDATDWNTGDSFLLGGNDMKFDFVIGNPPYQDDNGIDKSRKAPVYDKFMEAAYKVGKQVELITPARFLFDAGGTPKDFNKKMLSDPHLKVLDYQPDARKVFKNVEIKGGVAITLRDEDKDFGAIGTFMEFDELKTIHRKVCVDNPNFRPLSEIIYTPIVYKLSEKFFAERPELRCKLQKPDDTALRSNIFERLPEIFFDEPPADGHEYIQIHGRIGTERVCKWFRRDYVNAPAPLTKWKVLVPTANNTGTLGERLATPLVGSPLVGSPLVGNTETFITVGAFDTEAEALACIAYIKSRFCRVMLGIRKRTQHNTPDKWREVPLQDFTPASDIDWSSDADAQLYKKYGLDAAEVEFIETHVKEMT